jgi:hypothetical protein
MFNVHDCATGRTVSPVSLTLEEATKLLKKLRNDRPEHPFMIVTL